MSSGSLSPKETELNYQDEEGLEAMTQPPDERECIDRDHGPYHSLETGVQLCQERGLVQQGQNPLFHHGALHVIVLDHHVLLQDFDGIQFLCSLPVSEHHLGREGEKVNTGGQTSGAGSRGGGCEEQGQQAAQ